MVLSKTSKRLGVFVFFDKDSIIDDYVIYLLDSLNDAVNKIIFVSNCNLSKQEIQKLDKYKNIDVNIRENKGLDAGAFKFVYDKYGKDYICEYDELILLNDTFFGPFKPFKQIINEMNKDDIDFWGLTANYDSPDGTKKAIDGYIHSHIQTYFIAYRKSILSSDFFNDYWNKYNINKNNSFETVVNNHESYFTYLLEKEGFKWDTYINLDHYKNDNMKYNYNIYGYSSYTLLKYFNCPFIKRKNFVFNKVDALYINDGMDTSNALKWIKENTDYDINMIYKNIIRLYSPYDIYQSLNLNYIIDKIEKNKKAKTAIIANINDDNAYNLSKLYFDNISICDKYLYTENKELSKSINELTYTDNLYKKIMKLKKELIEKYDYVCFLNLKDENTSFQEIVDSSIIRTLENTINSDSFVNGVIDVFENNIIDILFTPESFHNKNIMNITGANKYKIVKKLNDRTSKNITSNKLIKSFDGLWIRSEVLNNIVQDDITYEELIALFEIFIKNRIYGKMYNRKYIKNDILSLEVICNYCLHSNKAKLSFPNRMTYVDNAGPLRRLFRRIVPLSIRKKLKILFKIENDSI